LLKLSILTLIIIIPALLIGARFGIIGVAVGHLIAILIRRVISLGLATRFVNVTILDIFGELRSSLIAAVVMAPITFAVYTLTTGLNPFLQLIFIVLSGAMSYLGVLWWIEKENLLRLLRIVRVSEASAEYGNNELIRSPVHFCLRTSPQRDLCLVSLIARSP